MYVSKLSMDISKFFFKYADVHLTFCMKGKNYNKILTMINWDEAFAAQQMKQNLIKAAA